MDHIQAAVDLWSRVVELLRNHVPPERWPNATLWSALALPIGLLLALWGARIIRTLFVLAFMVLGGYVGMRVARAGQVEPLMGLVLGAGLLGVMGHLFFRWWLGFSAATMAMLIVLLSSAPRVATEVQAFNDYQTGLATGQYILSQPKADVTPFEQARQYVMELRAYLWQKRPELVSRLAVLLGLAGLLGMSVGVLMPRLTMIIGTSLLGVVLLAAGLGFFLSTWCQPVWVAFMTHTSWSLAACGVLLLMAISYQARGPRVSSASASPATVTA
jgi:hypothetical protein